MKKIIVLAATVVLVLGVLTGCSQMSESFQRGYADATNGEEFNPQN